jgi:hypothetical protein
MSSATEFQDYARECVCLAGLTNSRELRDQLLEMAREWMNAVLEANEAAGLTASENKLKPRLPGTPQYGYACCRALIIIR